MTRKLVIVAAMATTLIATCLRAARLPNNFATEHWLIDYRFGFVKRGLVGSLVSLAAGALGARPSEGAIDALAVVAFGAFCAAIMWVCVRLLRRGRWSSDLALAALVFLSSPFIVMSAHLVGYYDNIVVMLAIVSLALVFERRTWAAAVVQGISLLVHENTLLIALPAVVWAAWLDARSSPRAARRMLPLLVPIVMFALLAVRQGTAPHHLESSLTHYLATYPFVAGTLADVRVPHWVTIGFYDSYRLHQGHLQERLLSQTMIALVFPSLLALVGALFAADGVAAVSADLAIVLVICLLPQAMHVMVWDTSRTWTYSILCAFLLLWIDVERRPTRPRGSQFGMFVSVAALVMNAIAVTPLMDGLREHFEVTARLWIYAPVFAVGLGLARQSRPRASGEPGGPLVT
ncbi:MAG: hypothetical protein JF610_02445 [Acidobacteria bacterium]|nr:hypothetical protein [Acidobacteriota bacterium]